MKLSEMKQILAGSNIRLSKSLGQNFLHDGNQLRRIVAAGELTAADRVLEIGPGLGPLTDLLVAQAGSVLAIEKDRRLVDVLRQRFCGVEGIDATRVLLLHDDALRYLQRESSDWSDWKMVSNLPYSVASPILVELAQAQGCPERMVATVQREVAQRIVAKPGDEDYGLLTLLIQLRYKPRGWFKVRANCFFPRPEVDSACVTLLRRSKPLLNQEQADTFTRIVKRAFSQRRKMMLKLLRKDWPPVQLTAAWEYLELSPGARAEQVSLEQFVSLTNLLASD
jgi:16S rRNA (adenine1518-N6/adenine1519-N6)-dimethyltransferase